MYQEHSTSMNVTRNPGSLVGMALACWYFYYHHQIGLNDWNTIWKDIKVSHLFNMNVYDVVTQICSYNYSYCFELFFENFTAPNMQLQLYILSWVIFYQSCCVFSKLIQDLCSFKVILLSPGLKPKINRNRSTGIALLMLRVVYVLVHLYMTTVGGETWLFWKSCRWCYH